jgi:hypothetical protein
MNRRKKLTLQGIIFSCMMILPAMGHTEWGDIVKKFHPSLNVQEEYTSNVDLTSTNPREEWITTISPGIRFSTQREVEPQPGQISRTYEARGESGVNLSYNLGLVYYARGTYENYVSQNAALDAWYTFVRKLNVALKDTFIKSEEPRELQYAPGAPPGSYLPGNTQRAKYYRNVLEPSMEYRYGAENRLSLYYRNNVYNNESPQYEDSTENYISPRIDHWFNIHNGITLEGGYTNGDFETSPDLQGYMGRGRYTYRFNPRTSIFGDYIYQKLDFDSPGVDYDVQNPSIGILHAFSPSTSGNLQVGYFWQNPESGSSQNGVTLDASLITSTIRTTYSLYLRGGFREDYFTAQNLGFSKYYGAYGNIAHRLTQRFNAALSGFVERDEYNSGQDDWVWQGGASLSYQPLRWLTFTLEALHREDDSSVDSADYKENRGMLSITASL